MQKQVGVLPGRCPFVTQYIGFLWIKRLQVRVCASLEKGIQIMVFTLLGGFTSGFDDRHGVYLYAERILRPVKKNELANNSVACGVVATKVPKESVHSTFPYVRGIQIFVVVEELFVQGFLQGECGGVVVDPLWLKGLGDVGVNDHVTSRNDGSDDDFVVSWLLLIATRGMINAVEECEY